MTCQDQPFFTHSFLQTTLPVLLLETTWLNYINTELNKMAVWFRANKMAVNAEKTKYIIFHTKNKRVDPGNSVLVFDNNEPGQP